MPQSLNDLLPTTPDLRQERLAELKRLFPDLFTNEGKLDPDELKRLVAPNEIHETERYEFKWYGKAASKREAFTPTTATLVYDEARSVNPDKANGNMIIEGENLETLKLLLSAYCEEVKVICIDPPYNTGKDFIYKDNYAKDRKSYWEETGLTEEGVKLSSNSETSGRFHSDWLSMMHSRLLVARSLLKEEGLIAVFIDDSELTNLSRLLDEVFGPEAFIAKIIWKKRNGPPADKTIGTIHDYILLYAKNPEKTVLHLKPRSLANISSFKNPDNHPKGVWMSGDLTANVKGGRYVASLYFPIRNPNTGEDHYPPNNGNWRFSRTTIEEMLRNDEIYFGADGKGRPARKRFLKEMKDGVSFSTLWDEIAYNADGGREIGAVMGNPNIFDNPKPLHLISELLSLTATAGDTYLDFFGGSGTSMIAALKRNGIRSILVQIPEETVEDSPACRDGFQKISDVTIERVKRVIQGYGDNPQPLPDTGFKVYKLSKSNFPRCEFTPDPKMSDDENVEALKRYIHDKEAASLLPLEGDVEQAVFDEVLLKCGFQLHYTRSLREDFTENTVYEVTDGKRSTLACLAWNEGIKDATVKRLRELDEAKEKPFFICLERSLTTTSKWNLDHLLGKRLTAF
jgi:adenine-specific DNA-methyltransferase